MLRDIDFQDLKSLIESGSSFILDVYAKWCHPCKLVDVELDRVQEEKPGLDVVRIDYDRFTELSDYLGIGSLPFLLIYKDGERAGKIKGFQRAESILGEISKNGL